MRISEGFANGRMANVKLVPLEPTLERVSVWINSSLWTILLAAYCCGNKAQHTQVQFPCVPKLSIGLYDRRWPKVWNIIPRRPKAITGKWPKTSLLFAEQFHCNSQWPTIRSGVS
jgi:hypothetical protein